MIMKTVKNKNEKIDHVEYGDNVIYLYTSKNRQGRSITEAISKRITGRIMKKHTDEEYDTLLETVSKKTRKAVRDLMVTNQKRSSCRSCKLSGTCKGVRSCIASLA